MSDVDAHGRSGAARWRVVGRVQGVGFRWFVQQRASRLGLGGDVCNLPDGRVEVRALGTPEALGQLLEALREGPAGARVDRVETLEPDGALQPERFEIRWR